MKQVIIYKPEKSPTQSGLKKLNFWILESSNYASLETDPLTGWKGKNDHEHTIKLKFNTKEEALTYAKKNRLFPKVIEEKSKSIKIKSYADNFKYNRIKSDV